MAEWFKNNGDEVEVVASIPHYPQFRPLHEFKNKSFSLRQDNLRVNYIPLWIPDGKSGSAKSRVLYELSFLFYSIGLWLKYIFKKETFDIIVGVYPSLTSLILPLIYSKIRRIPIHIHVQDLQVDAAEKLNIIGNKYIIKFLQSAERILFNSSSEISTISERMREKIIAKGIDPHKCTVVKNWASIEVSSETGLLLREQLGYGNSDIIVLYSGNLGEKQGLEMIIDAADGLRDFSNIKFLICGSGFLENRLKKDALAKNLTNLKFIPLQPVETLPLLLKMGDIHLVIQKAEAADLVMPSKMTNIMASGRPMIATAVKNTSLYNIVSGVEVGIVVPPGDVNELTSAIVSLGRNAELRYRMGRNAEEYAYKELSKNEILKILKKSLFTASKVSRSI